MEATRFTGIESNYKDFPGQPRLRQLTINIALLDQSPSQTPIVYVLRRDIWDADLVTARDSLSGHASRDPLAILGPALNMDRQNKRIYLTDNVILFYNHLIVFTPPHVRVSSSAFEDRVSAGAVQTLVDAMRCMPIRPLQLAEAQLNQTQKICASQTYIDSDGMNELDLVQCLAAPMQADQLNSSWNSAGRWLFQIQA